MGLPHVQNIPPNSYRIHILLSIWWTNHKTGHILEYKASLNKYKKAEITSYILSDHNEIKLEINSKRKIYKHVEIKQ
jgi:hypothetical protein